MSSEQQQKPCEKGNVARIVDRLSKDYGSGIGGNNTPVLTKSENVPLRNRVMNTSSSTFGLPFQLTETAVVRFSYSAQQPDELDLKEGDELAVLAHTEDGWARGEIINSPSNPGRKGLIGLYPTNFVSTSSPTPSKQIPPTLSSPSSTFPRSIDSSHDKSHQENSNSTTLITGVSLHQLSSSAPKSTTIGSVGNTFSSLGNGGSSAITSSPGVLHTGNLLPSSILRGGGGTISGRSGENRRINSTLIPENNSSNNHSIVEKETAKVLYKYDAAAPDELSLPEGTIVTVINRQCEDEGWFIAESLDGRRGLFPDNFVKFLPCCDSSLNNNIQNSSLQQQPPSLPAKPSKFIPSTQGHSQPVAFVRDSLFSDSTKHSIMSSSEAKTPIITTTETTTIDSTKMTTSTISLLNNNNNDIENNSTTNTQQNISTSNIAGNRHSMIAGMQKILFPGGKLPQMQQPGSRNSTIISGGNKLESTSCVEPKMTDFDNNNVINTSGLNKQQQNSNKLLTSSSIVNARTKIAPSNKRPPSTVNSAAMLAANTRDSFNNDTSNLLDTSTTTTTTTNTKTTTTISSNLSSTTTTQQQLNNKTTTSVFSASLGEETTNNNQQSSHQRYIPISERIGYQPIKTSLITSQIPSISLVSSLNPTPIQSNKSGGGGETTSIQLSSSPESIHHTDQTINNITSGGGINLSSQQLPSSSFSSSTSSTNWVSRVDFDRFVEECNRKFSEMNGELIDLRRKLIEATQNK